MLTEAAAFVNREEGVVWENLANIACSSYVTKRHGPTLRIRVFAREAKLDVPDGAENVIVELPDAHGEPDRETVTLYNSSRKRLLRLHEWHLRPVSHR